MSGLQRLREWTGSGEQNLKAIYGKLKGNMIWYTDPGYPEKLYILDGRKDTYSIDTLDVYRKSWFRFPDKMAWTVALMDAGDAAKQKHNKNACLVDESGVYEVAMRKKGSGGYRGLRSQLGKAETTGSNYFWLAFFVIGALVGLIAAPTWSWTGTAPDSHSSGTGQIGTISLLEPRVPWGEVQSCRQTGGKAKFTATYMEDHLSSFMQSQEELLDWLNATITTDMGHVAMAMQSDVGEIERLIRPVAGDWWPHRKIELAKTSSKIVSAFGLPPERSGIPLTTTRKSSRCLDPDMPRGGDCKDAAYDPYLPSAASEEAASPKQGQEQHPALDRAKLHEMHENMKLGMAMTAYTKDALDDLAAYQRGIEMFSSGLVDDALGLRLEARRLQEALDGLLFANRLKCRYEPEAILEELAPGVGTLRGPKRRGAPAESEMTEGERMCEVRYLTVLVGARLDIFESWAKQLLRRQTGRLHRLADIFDCASHGYGKWKWHDDPASVLPANTTAPRREVLQIKAFNQNLDFLVGRMTPLEARFRQILDNLARKMETELSWVNWLGW